MIVVPLSYLLLVASILFAIGVIGLLINRRNLIAILMSLELMLLAINTNFIAFSSFYNQISGQIFVFFILTVAAAETAIGLGIFILLYSRYKTLDVDRFDSLFG